MKADFDDAPEWLRAGQKKSGMPALFAWVVGVCVTLGALQVGSQAFLQGTLKNLAAEKQKPTPVAVISKPTQERRTETDWQLLVEEQARIDAARLQKDRKTPAMPGTEPVINKAYKPGEAINILTFNETYVPEEPKSKSKGVRVTVVAETKDSACWPLKEGSVERRNCKFSQGLSR